MSITSTRTPRPPVPSVRGGYGSWLPETGSGTGSSAGHNCTGQIETRWLGVTASGRTLRSDLTRAMTSATGSSTLNTATPSRPRPFSSWSTPLTRPLTTSFRSSRRTRTWFFS
ncbi:hypothetical protein ACFQV2_11650 [Actinokineospora soli]|uniref:Uncharacterized protein n=1 Tax=Actinokineospora soli TaxID=1048753 RepID=A0ABW2TL60_9PSEU